jgi:hypothetical protein
MTDAKYGAEARALMAATGAESVFVVVVGGIHGHGIASVTRGGSTEPKAVADMLHRLAVQFDHAAASGEPFDITITPSPDH